MSTSRSTPARTATTSRSPARPESPTPRSRSLPPTPTVNRPGAATPHTTSTVARRSPASTTRSPTCTPRASRDHLVRRRGRHGPLGGAGSDPRSAEHDYLAVVNTYHIYNLDFDVEGALQGNTQALTTQAQAIAMLQAQEAANGTPVTVSYTLPVLPSGLVEGQGGGMNVLQIANTNGVAVSRVNVMAMDYGNGFDQPGNPGMGTYAIDAATATHTQLMTLYPSLTSQQAWNMVGVTPLIGINDDPSEIFTPRRRPPADDVRPAERHR